MPAVPTGRRWLSHKLVDGDAPYLFSIPKKVVRLATRRNRLRRLLREVLRKDIALKPGGRAHLFRIERWPGDIGYEDMKQAVRKVITP